jgi:hypothetical protein
MHPARRGAWETVLRAWPALVVATLLVAGACSAPSVRALPTSGVEGRVTVGPMCPVVREGETCPDRPLAADLVVRSADGATVVARATSGADGLYRIPLAPGRYRLIPRNPDGVPLPSAQPVEFTVVEGAFTLLDVAFDSGIR